VTIGQILSKTRLDKLKRTKLKNAILFATNCSFFSLFLIKVGISKSEGIFLIQTKLGYLFLKTNKKNFSLNCTICPEHK